jgi:ribonuclease Z
VEKLIVLGSGSALPTTTRNPSAQLIKSNSYYYLIDCGEGTQLRLRDLKIPFNRITHIFISHLHGDHIYGLPGLISTFSLLGRTNDLKIFGPKGIKEFIQTAFKLSESYLAFPYQIIEFEDQYNDLHLIGETKHDTFQIFSLNHRIKCYGYLIKEKAKPRKLIKEALEEYNIPLAYRNVIKQGADFQASNGEIIPNKLLTLPPKSAISYAYCSDNRIKEEQLLFLKGSKYLYHEATFEHELLDIAKKTMHSTAYEAGILANKLNVNTLLIGHYSGRYTKVDFLLNEAKQNFKNTIAVKDKQVIEF